MEKQRQMLTAIGENYESAAEKVCQFIVDPAERTKLLDDLKNLAVEHARLQNHFESQGKALTYVAQKLKESPNMDIEEVKSIYFRFFSIDFNPGFST